MTLQEAYDIGFTKAAAAAGVDPQRLYKRAARRDALTKAAAGPRYKTDGWAPDVVREVDKKGYMPMYNVRSDGMTDSAEIPKSPSSIMSEGDEHLARFADRGGHPLLKARMDMDPRYGAWLRAHEEAARAVGQPLRKAYSDAEAYSARRNGGTAPRDFYKHHGFWRSNEALGQLAGKLYRDNMYKLTNGVPASASSSPSQPRQSPGQPVQSPSQPRQSFITTLR